MLVQHLQQSKDAACQRARNEHEASMRQPTRRSHHHRVQAARSRSQNHSSDGDTAPVLDDSAGDADPVTVPFDGDYYGTADDYAPEDLPFDDGDEGEPQMEAGDDDDGEDEGEDEDEGDDNNNVDDGAVGNDLIELQGSMRGTGGGDANHYPGPMASDLDSDTGPTPMDVDATARDRDPSPEPADPRDAQTHLRQSPVRVIHFGGQAGKPVDLSSTAAQSKGTGYKIYAHEVDPKSQNPYAPFTSRVDWEVAHWAKLRGSGSTAFSDLLAIEEVHPQHIQ